MEAVWCIPVIAVRLLVHAPVGQYALLQLAPARIDERQRRLPQLHEFVFECLEESVPDAALLAAIAPVAIDSRAGTLPLAGVKEPTALTAAVIPRGLIQRAVPLDPMTGGFDPVDPVFVRAAAVRPIAETVDVAHCRRRQGITRIPDARPRRAGQQQLREIAEDVEAQHFQLLLQAIAGEKGVDVFVFAE